MHKFTVTYRTEPKEVPSVYIIHIGNYIYVHKSKFFDKGVTSFLNNVFAGIRGKSHSKYYKRVVEYCLKYPALFKIEIEQVSTGEPATLLRKEKSLLKAYAKDPKCLNNFDEEPYQPNWMISEIFKKKCTECIKSGIVDGKKKKFRFCPNCGITNKK